MIRRVMILAAAAASLAPAPASAQLRVPTIVQRVIPATRDRQHQQPVLVGIDALRADFLARSGSDTVYFGGDNAVLGTPARATLAAQAAWLRLHPEVVVQIEGHSATGDTRDHALAVGARRAEEVRQYLVLLGVPAAQLTAVSMGKERPVGVNARAVTVLVR
jgi:peptidoglycan-associated lipoprotein